MAQSSPDPLRFRVLDNTPPLVRLALLGKGWEEVPPGNADISSNLTWRSGRGIKPSEYSLAAASKGTRRVNHFPSTNAITRKDKLMRNLRKALAMHGAIYKFFPDGFLLPSEYTRFVDEWSRTKNAAALSNDRNRAAAAARAKATIHIAEGVTETIGEDDAVSPSSPSSPSSTSLEPQPEIDRAIWICKPSDSSRGRGVFLIQDLADLCYGQQYIVQR